MITDHTRVTATAAMKCFFAQDISEDTHTHRQTDTSVNRLKTATLNQLTQITLAQAYKHHHSKQLNVHRSLDVHGWSQSRDRLNALYGDCLVTDSPCIV